MEWVPFTNMASKEIEFLDITNEIYGKVLRLKGIMNTHTHTHLYTHTI